MDMVADPQAAQEKIQEVQQTLNGALNDALGQVEQMRRKMGL